MPGGTRHYEIANYFSELKWDIEVFSSDFNLSSRKYMILKNLELWKTEKLNGFTWHWLRTFPYKKNDFLRYFNLISFCLNFFSRQFFVLLIGNFLKSAPNIIIASSPQLPVAFFSLILAKIFKKIFIFEVRILASVLIDLGGFKRIHFSLNVYIGLSHNYIKRRLCCCISKGC